MTWSKLAVDRAIVESRESDDYIDLFVILLKLFHPAQIEDLFDRLKQMQDAQDNSWYKQ